MCGDVFMLGLACLLPLPSSAHPSMFSNHRVSSVVVVIVLCLF